MSNTTITAPAGFRCGAAACGIKKEGVLDLALLVADGPCAAAAVFTRNRFCGAPIVVGREHVRGGRLQAVVVNSGCSNVATGRRGIDDAYEMCRLTGERIGVPPRHVLPSSTGVIGRFLPMEKIRAGIDAAAADLCGGAEAGERFARAILTTDTRPKQACVSLALGNARAMVAGCCKGSGMIAPHLATMLAYVTTDAAVGSAWLRRVLRTVAERTFNRVTVDECQSTSDTVAVLASGRAGNRPIRPGSAEAEAFRRALEEVCGGLAEQIASDGEGATRVIEVRVVGARSALDAHRVARAIAASPLVKTAVHGADPNWGRIVQAIGASGANFDPLKVRVCIGPDRVFERGEPVREASLDDLRRHMLSRRVEIHVDLGAGSFQDRMLTCDLSEEYVAVNAEYTT